MDVAGERVGKGPAAARPSGLGGPPVNGALDGAGVVVHRSTRRRRTVTAYQDDGRIVLLIPAHFSPQEESQWVARMTARLSHAASRRYPGEDELLERAVSLGERYLDGRAVPLRVLWAGNQLARWGSCTPADGTIRLSTRLRGVPHWVLDYVLLHELTHLAIPTHGPAFWALLRAYPRTERARGYLEGLEAGSRQRAAERSRSGAERSGGREPGAP